jgi:hypothetical protein
MKREGVCGLAGLSRAALAPGTAQLAGASPFPFFIFFFLFLFSISFIYFAKILQFKSNHFQKFSKKNNAMI